MTKYNSYKGKHKVNKLLIIYLSKQVDDWVKDNLKNQKEDISAMSMAQFLLLYKMFKANSIDEDSFLAKIIRPGFSEIESTINIEDWLSRKKIIRLEIDPNWKYPLPTKCIIQPLPFIDLKIFISARTLA